MKIDAFEVKRGNGKIIRGNIYSPNDCSKTYPAVIFSPGFNCPCEALSHHAEEYVLNDIVFVLFDFYGGAVEGKSDGCLEELTIGSQVSDLELVKNTISELSFVDSEAVFLQGESQGGFVSTCVACKYPYEIKGLVLWYPAYVLIDDSKRRLENNDNICFGLAISPDFNKEASAIDIYKDMKSYKKPVLLLHGDKDELVPSSYSEKANETFKYSELELIKGAGHGFDGDDSKFARRKSIDFILETYRKDLVERIVIAEFEAFNLVKNEGGRASCQNDFATFSVMRKSQYLTWTRQMLEQYLSDFVFALNSGRNMITEKYGLMMESTAPAEFEKIKHMLPQLNDEKKNIIEGIVQIQVAMMESFSAEHADVASRARVIHTSEDGEYNTSYETYLRGELSTYSDEMLMLYGRYVVEAARNGKNIAEMTIGNTAILYGFDGINGL